MKQFILIAIFFWMAASTANAQVHASPHYLPGMRVDNDTLPHINISEINIIPKPKFKSKQAEQQYWKTVVRVKKVYPYAKEAARLYAKYQQEVPPDTKRRYRRTYIKKAEDELMALYGPKLKQMSITEGKILIKLIDRETQATSYDLIQDIKGGVPAIFWQGVARIFGNNLKSQYDPYGEDKQIEQIVRFIDMGLI
ncbi:MAG: DUF4294 domain-containing protein [Verrucomicrobia bacterium]|nr:DUF4294 domain-containing protein [Prolixibacteraceae bacterium]